MSRYDYIVFQLENHILRAGMILDRALQLVNVVFDLGLAPRECKFPVVASNSHVGPAVQKSLSRLQTVLQPIQTTRNRISHRETFDHEELYDVGLYSALQKASTSITTDPVLAMAAHLGKVKADAFVQRQRSELKAQNTDIFFGLSELFERLRPVYVTTRAKLEAR